MLKYEQLVIESVIENKNSTENIDKDAKLDSKNVLHKMTEKEAHCGDELHDTVKDMTDSELGDAVKIVKESLSAVDNQSC